MDNRLGMGMDWQKFRIDIRTQKTSGNFKAFCPECRDRRHDKRDRSLSCNLATGEFLCHYCGWSGCANVPDEDEKRRWMEQQPWYAPKVQKPEYRKPTGKGSPKLGDNALAWFASRGIFPPTLEAMRITEGPEWMPQKGGQANTVQFNYYLNGEHVNTKFRTGDKCFKLVPGAELLPYNIDAIRDTRQCVITEGEMDALSFIECGRKDVVSVPNGANSNLSYLDAYIESHFDSKETIYIAVDTDTKGTMLRDELLRRFGADRCRVVAYGEGCKDANEHLCKYGRQSLLQCLADAPETKVDGVFCVSDFEQSLDALFENGMQRGVTIGHQNFDTLCSFETKRLCIVTGIPGSGKSEFIDEICERLNIRHGWKSAYFSPENAPLAYHASKIVEKLTGRRFSSATLSKEAYLQAKQHMQDNFFFISPSDSFRLDNILDKARTLVRRKGIKVLVIDPYNRLESDQGAGESETRYISVLLDKLTNFAQIHDVLVVLMAHPTKMQRDKETGEYPSTTLYDISGSANFYNKADYGITVHRLKNEQSVLVTVTKVRFRHLGEPGKALFKYNINNGRYTPFEGGRAVLWDNSNHLTGEDPEPVSDSAGHLPAQGAAGTRRRRGTDCPTEAQDRRTAMHTAGIRCEKPAFCVSLRPTPKHTKKQPKQKEKMAYDKQKIFEMAKAAIEENNIFFFEDVAAFLPCSVSTLYEYFPKESEESEDIKRLMWENRISTKQRIRRNLQENCSNPTAQLALYRMICTPTEREAISERHKTDLTTGGKPIEIPTLRIVDTAEQLDELKALQARLGQDTEGE